MTLSPAALVVVLSLVPVATLLLSPPSLLPIPFRVFFPSPLKALTLTPNTRFGSLRT